MLDWVTGFVDTSVVVDCLSLQADNTYYFSVRCVDRAGNISEATSSVGLTIDLTPPEQGLVFDGLETDLNWTNQTLSLSASWSGFSDSQSGLGEYRISKS